ncbi:MauE/DoxX family redox-associated membrane protein [Malonomonas rubra]|uniref:MauE/DoxX family redox-associated membrane protein n=1 Tax=Malonomonas rubra TaxID=57040 RepID=UPI0026EE239D|nr:MauE/DoxX family redox-associated membrane protein [Malonomonas rubra]
MSKPTTVLYHLSRLILAVVFIYAGYIKAADPVAFAGQVANYQILPYAWNFLVAATLPYLELFSGVLLLLNQRVRPAVLVLFVLNLIFMVLLSYAAAKGLDIDCGCFKPDAESKTSPMQAFWRDAGLLLLMISTWMLRNRQAPPEEGLDG